MRLVLVTIVNYKLTLAMGTYSLPLCCAVLSHVSCVQLLVTPLTIACQVPLSMGFSRQEYWSGLPCPPPGDLPNSGIKHMSLKSSVLAGVTALISIFHPSSALPCIPGGWHPTACISLAPLSAGSQMIFVSGEHC